jgi:hypothetical protein
VVGNLTKDWPAYIMLGLMIAFFIYVIIKGNLPERKKEEGQDMRQDNTKTKDV